MLNASGPGNVGADPELRTFENGQVASFNVAFNKSYKKNDEWHNETTWMSCQAWGTQADKVMERVHKGTRVHVEGTISQNEWEKDGEKRIGYRMTVRRFEVCEKNGNGNGGEGNKKDEAKPEASKETVPAANEGNDDLPF